ncbi:MAG: helicase, partial [Pseudomonas sp. PGPPP3]
FSVTCDPARLAALPAAERNGSCLCPRCAGQAPTPAVT